MDFKEIVLYEINHEEEYMKKWTLGVEENAYKEIIEKMKSEKITKWDIGKHLLAGNAWIISKEVIEDKHHERTD